jgi:iron complex outermembrane receptor protein
LSITKTKGVYASLAYDIMPNLTVSVEGRYQNDNIATFSYIVPANFPTPNVVPAVAFNPLVSENQRTFKPRALIQWHPTDKVMIYTSYAEGGNPGGFNTNLIQYNATQQQMLKDLYGITLEILPEKIKSWELGVKGTFLDNRAQLTADVYHAIWVNQVVSSQISISNIPGILPTSFFTSSQNVGQTNFTGIELEGTVVAAEGLTLNGAFDYNPSTIKKYICASCKLSITGSDQVTGNHMASVAATTANFGIQYNRPLTDELAGYVRADWTYQGRIWSDETNLSWIPASSKVALRAGIERGKVSVEGYVTNLLDDSSWSGVLRSTDVFHPGTNDFILGFPQRRTFGLRVRAAM